MSSDVLESAPFWVNMALAIGAVSTAFLAATALALRLGVGAKWLTERIGAGFQSAVGDVVDEKLEPIRNELNPNGGMSLRDVADRTERTLNDYIDVSTASRKAIKSDLEEYVKISEADSARRFAELWERIGDVPIDHYDPPPER